MSTPTTARNLLADLGIYDPEALTRRTILDRRDVWDFDDLAVIMPAFNTDDGSVHRPAPNGGDALFEIRWVNEDWSLRNDLRSAYIAYDQSEVRDWSHQWAQRHDSPGVTTGPVPTAKIRIV